MLIYIYSNFLNVYINLHIRLTQFKEFQSKKNGYSDTIQEVQEEWLKNYICFIKCFSKFCYNIKGYCVFILCKNVFSALKNS